MRPLTRPPKDLRDAICTPHLLASQSPRTPRGRIQEPSCGRAGLRNSNLCKLIVRAIRVVTFLHQEFPIHGRGWDSGSSGGDAPREGEDRLGSSIRTSLGILARTGPASIGREPRCAQREPMCAGARAAVFFKGPQGGL